MPSWISIPIPIQNLYDMSLGSEFLSFLSPSGGRTSALPPDLCALIVDTVQAPATFLLTNFLAKALRNSPPRQSTLLGLAHTFEHYEAILKKNVSLLGGIVAPQARRSSLGSEWRWRVVNQADIPTCIALQGIHLSVERKKGNFNYLEGAWLVGAPTLEPLYRQIETQLSQPSAQGSLILIDDLSCLLWAGHDSRSVAAFFAGVRALVAQVSRRDATHPCPHRRTIWTDSRCSRRPDFELACCAATRR